MENAMPADDLPLNERSDHDIIKALQTESRGLEAAAKAIDQAAKEFDRITDSQNWAGRKTSKLNVVVDKRLYWHEQGQELVILVKRHPHIKALTRKMRAGEKKPFGLEKDAPVALVPEMAEDLQRRATDAYLGGRESTVDGWRFLPKPTRIPT
jgi:hypothetical protein